MADYKTKDIRNIALLGHGGEGKTTLVESMLFAAGITDRQGKVEDGTTVTDFEPEEIRRKFSISAACAPVDWNEKMLNIIDVPGYFDFVAEQAGPLRVVETACIVVNGVTGFSVGAEKAFKNAVKHGVGRIFAINQMDRDHASFDKVTQQIRERHGSCVVPVLLPIGEGPSFKGVVNVLEKKAYIGAYNKITEAEIPAEMADKVETAFEYLTEQAAAADEELMMKYLEEFTLDYEEILTGFRKGMKDGTIVPVCAVSALTGVGIAPMMNLMAKYFPSPAHEGIEHNG